MRVIIFDQMGNVLNKFGCSKHLEFPNGVVVNDKEEIFISDNRAHCVKVATFFKVVLWSRIIVNIFKSVHSILFFGIPSSQKIILKMLIFNDPV